MALFSNIAVTDESTPPDSPNNTFSFPTCSLISFTLCSIRSPIFQSFLHLQIRDTKLPKISRPKLVCDTSG